MTFFFDLCSPWTYLAAERADRTFGAMRWCPASAYVLECAAWGRRGRRPPASAVRAAAERRAAALRMPLVWPESWPWSGVLAMRVASLAAEQRRAAAFVLAAGRLAFCGGYDLDDPETFVEAAAAAGIGLDAALEAARDEIRDVAIARTALRLARRGAGELPVVGVGRTLFCGERRLPDAAAAAAGRMWVPHRR